MCMYVECPSGHFKPTASNERCQICPPNSETVSEQSPAVSCHCLQGYFRSTDEDATSPCTSSYIIKILISELAICSQLKTFSVYASIVTV